MGSIDPSTKGSVKQINEMIGTGVLVGMLIVLGLTGAAVENYFAAGFFAMLLLGVLLQCGVSFGAGCWTRRQERKKVRCAIFLGMLVAGNCQASSLPLPTTEEIAGYDLPVIIGAGVGLGIIGWLGVAIWSAIISMEARRNRKPAAQD